MAILYLDTSAVVKLYVEEPGTQQMLELAHPDAGNQLAILSITRVEFRAAVRRRTKLRDIDTVVADALIQSFQSHLAAVYQVQPVNDVVLETAASLIDRHTLRGYDSIQLAGCLALCVTINQTDGVRFVCADSALLAVAAAEGIETIDPSQ